MRPPPRPLAASPAKGPSQYDAALLAGTNRLLDAIGLGDQPFESVEEVCGSASSLLVAVFEALFATRIAGVQRRPVGAADYVNNAQLALDTLRALLPARVTIPADVSGEAIAAGDRSALAFIVALFLDLDRVIRAGGAPLRPEVSMRAPTPPEVAAEVAQQQRRAAARRGSLVSYSGSSELGEGAVAVAVGAAATAGPAGLPPSPSDHREGGTAAAVSSEATGAQDVEHAARARMLVRPLPARAGDNAAPAGAVAEDARDYPMSQPSGHREEATEPWHRPAAVTMLGVSDGAGAPSESPLASATGATLTDTASSPQSQRQQSPPLSPVPGSIAAGGDGAGGGVGEGESEDEAIDASGSSASVSLADHHRDRDADGDGLACDSGEGNTGGEPAGVVVAGDQSSEA